MSAPVVYNYNTSCQSTSPNVSHFESIALTSYDLFRCAVVILVTLALILGNSVLALAVNSKYSAGILQFQTRCLLTSIATNHVAMGLLVTAWSIYPSLNGCWPYGVLLCQIQAVLLGSLSQHNSILWILIATDRYIFATRRGRYLRLAGSKHCVWVVGLTWSLSFGFYTCLVLPYSAFDYSNNGLAGCEPVPQTGVLMLVSTCLIYFPTTMILLYVYGTVFHSNHVTMSRKHNSCNDQCTSCYCNVKVEESITRTMATMSLTFIINSTPWVIKQIIVACLRNEVQPWLDFIITWSSLSLGVWNPILCWLLCPPVRDGARHIISTWCCCESSNYSHSSARRSSTWNTELSNGLPPQCEVHRPHNNSPASRPTSPIRNLNVSSTAIDQDERVWGEILERSLSSGSLHHLHRLYGDHLDNGSSNIETTAASWNNKRPDTNWPVTPKSRP